MTDEEINMLIIRLNEVTDILTKEIPLPDMDVQEWNQTPIGRAVNLVGGIIETLEAVETE